MPAQDRHRDDLSLAAEERDQQGACRLDIDTRLGLGGGRLDPEHGATTPRNSLDDVVAEQPHQASSLWRMRGFGQVCPPRAVGAETLAQGLEVCGWALRQGQVD